MGLLIVGLVAFGFGFIGSMPLAGPVALLVFSRTIEDELGEALRIAAGAAVAEGIYAAVAFWGFATFLARHPVVLPISHGVTAVVLLAVGVYFMFWRQGAPKESRRERRGTFLVGFTVSALNPTLLVTWSAAVAWLYSKQLVDMSSWMAWPFGGMAAFGVGAWFALLIGLLRRYRDRFPRAVLMWVVRGMGLLLVGLALWSCAQLAGWIASR